MHEIMDVKSYEKYLMKLQISLRKFFIKMYMEFVLYVGYHSKFRISMQ